VFCDNDISASKGKRRPEYDEMLQWVRDGKLDLLIAYSASRFTRKPQENLDLIDLAEGYGIQLATATGQYDLATSEGRYQFRDAGNRAAREAEEIAERVQLKHAELRADGKFHGGQRGFGHKHTPVIVGNRVRYRVELHEQEAQEIRQAARRILTGGTISGINKDWGVRGIRRPKGRIWDTARIRELLTSARIAGLRENGAEFVPAEWPAIITRQQWEQLRAILGERPTAKGPKEPRSYLLSGIAICDLCGTSMIGQARNKVPAYACRQERGGCGRLHRMAEPFDNHIRDAVLTALASPTFRASLEARYQPEREGEIDALVANRDTAWYRLKELRDALADGTIEIDDFAHAKKRLDEVIDNATAKLSELQSTNTLIDLPESRELLDEFWNRIDLDSRRAVIRLCLSEVILKAPGGGKRFAPTLEHVDPIWRV
jgi:site-specific DNA recombinase